MSLALSVIRFEKSSVGASREAVPAKLEDARAGVRRLEERHEVAAVILTRIRARERKRRRG